uniref:hypothetical protein n=1 Tax=Streptomyces anulatus TaxID=1892 RepID=UPI001ADFD038
MYAASDAEPVDSGRVSAGSGKAVNVAGAGAPGAGTAFSQGKGWKSARHMECLWGDTAGCS